MYSNDDMSFRADFEPFVQMAKKFFHREKNYLDTQRQLITCWYTFLLSIGLVANLMELTGPTSEFFKYSNGTLLALTWIWFVGYALQWFRVNTVVRLMTLTTLVVMTTNAIYGAIVPDMQHMHVVILIHMIVLLGNITFSLATYQTMFSLINIGVSILAYVLCALFTNDPMMIQSLAIVVLTLLYTGVLGVHISSNAERLQKENTMMKHDEAELLHILRLNKKQVKSYIRLARAEYTEDQTRLLLAQFDQTTQRHIIANVTRFIRAEASVSQRIEKAFPELTPSERRIVQLILRDRKLSDLCSLLNKTESNINTQRANIRRKLGLQPKDNLKDKLEERMRGYVDIQDIMVR